jgi:hypothetical protein
LFKKTTERQTNENTFQNNLEKDTENHLLQIKKICSNQNSSAPNKRKYQAA